MIGLCLLTFLCQYNIFSNISIALLMKPFPFLRPWTMPHPELRVEAPHLRTPNPPNHHTIP